MRRDGAATRERILDAAESLVLARGYAGMTVDNILETVGITKGAFFYHFKSKDELASVLLKRFAARDAETYERVRARAESLSDDPLQQLLLFTRLFEEMFDGLREPYPGCLFASYVYELQQFDDATRSLIRDSFLKWRELLAGKIEAVVRKYPPRRPVDCAVLADTFTVVLEGAFVTSKAIGDPGVIVEQIRQFRTQIELLFSPVHEAVLSSSA